MLLRTSGASRILATKLIKKGRELLNLGYDSKTREVGYKTLKEYKGCNIWKILVCCSVSLSSVRQPKKVLGVLFSAVPGVYSSH